MDEIQQQHEARGKQVGRIVKKVIEEKIVSESSPSIDLFNMTIFRERLNELTSAFQGVSATHGLAVKANPIRGVLNVAKEMGFGAECASFPEAKHSMSLGFEPRKIIFDSPCKTLSELKETIQAGCYINLDNEEEIEKVNKIFAEDGGFSPTGSHTKQLGLRVNPVIGGGTIESTSTATASSKFGLPWTNETTERLFEIYQANPWLQGVHCHIGSQGIAIEMLVQGIKRVVDFANMVNERLGHDQIQVLDIGGGLPTVYDGISEAFTFAEYAQALKQAAPDLLSGKYHLMTEFGRSVFVKPGITVTKVEAIKTWCDQRFVVVHVGANQFLRTAYLPHQWKHALTVFSPDGKVKSGPLLKHDIAGPMCFSGDFLGKGVMLPQVETGDFLVIHDTGGYTTSMYSKYNSRCANAMYSYDANTCQMNVLKHRESCEETLAFWGLSQPTPLE